MRVEMEKNGESDVSGLLTTAVERTKIALPSYGGVEFECVIAEPFGDSVLWIKDAYVYSFHGEVSLSFVFASPRYETRYTARVLDRISPDNQADDVVFMSRVRMLVEVEGASHALEMLLCETASGDAPAILSRRDAALFSRATQNPQ